MDPELLEALRRHSGLRLDSEGRFFFHDRPVENQRVQALFHRHLTVQADGDVTLTVGEQWAYVDCETVGRFVDSLRFTEGRLEVRLRHDPASVTAEPWLGFDSEGRCYLWLTMSGPPAILVRSAHQALASLLEEVDGEMVLPLKSGPRPVRALAATPEPAAPWPG
jgi:hypothetical protein